MPVERCGLRGTVKIAFLAPPATEVADWIPGLQGSPELEGKGGSLVVVTTEQSWLRTSRGSRAQQEIPTSSVRSDSRGEPNVYSDVSADGLTIPPGVDTEPIWDDGTICRVFVESPTCIRQEVP